MADECSFDNLDLMPPDVQAYGACIEVEDEASCAEQWGEFAAQQWGRVVTAVCMPCPNECEAFCDEPAASAFDFDEGTLYNVSVECEGS